MWVLTYQNEPDLLEIRWHKTGKRELRHWNSNSFGEEQDSMVRLRARCPQFPDLPAYCRSAGLVKHPKVQRWLERHPRLHMPFTRTSTSWLSGAFLPGSHPQS